MKRDKILVRTILLLVGAFFLGLGVSLSIRSMLGTSPIDSFPYVMSLVIPELSIGTVTIILNSLFLVAQWAILGRRFGWHHLLELPAVAAFGLCIDLAQWFTRDLVMDEYYQQLGLTLLSCVAVAIGAYMMVRSDITCLPGDGVCLAIAERYGWDFGRVHIVLDTGLTLLSLVVSLLCLGQVMGVREGTVIAALLVGYIVSLLQRHERLIDRLLEDDEELTVSHEEWEG